MSGLKDIFDPPKPKPLPKVELPDPTPVVLPKPNDALSREAELLERQRAAKRKGRASTILTGPSQGLASPTYVNTLLGE